MRRLVLVAVAVAFVVGTGACGGTFRSTARAPNAAPLALKGQKVVIVFLSDDAGLRRATEDALARELTEDGARASPTFASLDDAELHDRDLARRKLGSLGAAAAVILRVVPAQAAARRWHARPLWEDDFGPISDRTVAIEALVYGLAQGQLVWAGTTRPVEASRLTDFSAVLAAAIGKEMIEAGFLPRPEDDWGSRLGSDIGLGR